MATTQTRLSLVDLGRRMTLDEFRDADAEPGYLYELGQGIVEVTQVPNDPHRQVLDNLREAISIYRQAHFGLMRCRGGGAEFQLGIPSADSVRHPDLGIVFAGTPKDNRGRRQPSWVAEIVSSGNEACHRDYVAKREEYLAFGLWEYWIVGTRMKQVTVLTRQETSSGPGWREGFFGNDEAIRSELLPGFELTVTRLWIDAELDEDVSL